MTKNSRDAAGSTGVSPLTIAAAVFGLLLVVALWQTNVPARSQPIPAGTGWPGVTVAGWLNGPVPEQIDLARGTSSAQAYDLNAAVASGKVVFVDCMASWCGPCLAEMPRIVKAAESYRPLGVEFVSLTMETEVDVQKLHDFLDASPGADWPLGYGAHDFFEALQIRGIPTYLVFVNGKVSWSGSGRQDFTTALDQAVAARKSRQ